MSGGELLNNFVCSAQYRRRNCTANLASCFEIDNELVLPGGFHGQIARFSACENLIHIYCCAPDWLGKARSIAYECSGIRMVPRG
jgi:hypothetical protein